MELSPDERQRVYLEEKARLEARQQPKQEPTKPKQSISIRKWALIFFFLTVASAVVNGSNSFPLLDRFIAGVLLGTVVAILVGAILAGWKRYTTKTRT